MEESWSRRGAAAVSKKSAAAGRSAYADVFGGPPRFAARLNDYAEIFGDLPGSCSIPFLDLPPALDGRDAAAPARARGGAGFDYSEVFGSPDFGEFAAPYEELFAAPKGEAARSSNGRDTEKSTCSQQATEELKFSPRHSHGGLTACQEGDRSTSNSNPSDNGSTQFNMSYNKTSQGSTEGAMSGQTHATEVLAVPSFSFVVDADTPFQTIGDDGPHNMQNNRIDNGKHQNKLPANSSWDNIKSSENFSRGNQIHSTNKYPVSENGENGLANASHHSRSSSSSMSSGDVSSSDIMYLTVSDISLRTQPLRVPPPSRLPPRILDKQGHPRPRILSSPKIGVEEVSFSRPVANEEDFHAHQEVVKDNSPNFFDVEVDVSSAAAASAAAIKEAMELAQAKLKSAKDLMEKKRDNFQNSKKLDRRESIKHKERKLGQVSIGQESFEEMLITSEKGNEVTRATKLTPHYKEKEKVVLTEEDGQTRLGNDLKSSKVLSNLADKSEKWKTNKEFHELVNNEKYKMTEEVSKREGSMTNTKIMTMISEVKQNESENDALACEIESNRKLRKDNVALVACVHEENSNLEAHDSHVEEFEKPGEVHELHGQEEVIKIPYAGEKAPSFAGCEKKMETSDNRKLHYTHDDKGEKGILEYAVKAHDRENSCKLVEVNESKEEKGKSEAAKSPCEKYEKEMNIADIAPEPSKGEEKLNVTIATAGQEETEIQVACGSCITKRKRMEGVCEGTDLETTRRQEKKCDAENVNQLQGTMAAPEQEKREELHIIRQSCLSTENESRLKVDQADKLEEDLKKWKSTVGAMAHEEQEKLMKATKFVCWQDCNENKAKEAQLELQQRDKKEDETLESYNLENFEGQKMYEKDLQVCGNEGIIDIQVESHLMDKIMSINAVPLICKRLLNMTLGVQPSNLSDKEGTGSYLSLVSMESQPVASQRIISDVEWKRDEMEKQARKLEEEKENERIEEEKEKTRLLEEAKEMKRKFEEEKERARSLEEAKDREKKLEEEKERAMLLEEAKERERKLEVEKAGARLLEEAKERERKLEEEKVRARLLEEAKERERKLEEEKVRARLLEEARERERKLEEEKAQARLLEEARERERKLEEEKVRARLLEAKERKRKLEEEKEQARLLAEEKQRKRKAEEELASILEAQERERKLEEEKDRVRLLKEAKEKEQKLEEKERVRLLEEEKEREREREKDRLAVERATREAHERAFNEARERAERIAVERVTSEVWQRALKEAREKAEKASSEALEKPLTEKASREARLRAERAAVERATAEARERAVERALAEKAAAHARESAERYNATSRDRTRKENVTEEHLKAREKDGPHDAQFQSNGSLSTCQVKSDYNAQCEGESALRCKARLERHQRIAERAAKALAEKNVRDILAQREQAERNRLAEYLDADVKRWSNGKEGNLRALLSTLQYILGPESGWQPIPLTDVITASGVKKAYRKATLCVHPDKLQQRGANIQQKYICEKVFDLLKEAWNRFNSEER